jgi:hypothetical protein
MTRDGSVKGDFFTPGDNAIAGSNVAWTPDSLAYAFGYDSSGLVVVGRDGELISHLPAGTPWWPAGVEPGVGRPQLYVVGWSNEETIEVVLLVYQQGFDRPPRFWSLAGLVSPAGDISWSEPTERPGGVSIRTPDTSALARRYESPSHTLRASVTTDLEFGGVIVSDQPAGQPRRSSTNIRSKFVTEVDGSVFEYDLGTAFGPLTSGPGSGAWDMARID